MVPKRKSGHSTNIVNSAARTSSEFHSGMSRRRVLSVVRAEGKCFYSGLFVEGPLFRTSILVFFFFFKCTNFIFFGACKLCAQKIIRFLRKCVENLLAHWKLCWKLLHGENSRNIRSRNLPVTLYFGDPYFSSMVLKISRPLFREATPFCRETRYFFTFKSPFLGEKYMKWFEIFRPHVRNTT